MCKTEKLIFFNLFLLKKKEIGKFCWIIYIDGSNTYLMHVKSIEKFKTTNGEFMTKLKNIYQFILMLYFIKYSEKKRESNFLNI